jgi:glycosyltransferase involved in cell wall biosynthesis
MKTELSIVMPCLNEIETIELCITKAQQFMQTHNISGEVVIGDNGSTDGSVEKALALGAVVVNVKEKGYGNASRGAIEAAKGKYIITADTDDSHDLLNLEPFVSKLNQGYELVMGNRFKGEQKKDAMPFLHRYLGNPVLTFIGNLFFRTSIGDFHCGLRGFSKTAYEKMDLNSQGMEFASEIVVKASMLNLKITEIPTTVFAAGRSRKPHLRTFPDGWRHLRFLLLYSPIWLFLVPGVLLFLSGIIGLLLLLSSGSAIEYVRESTLILGVILFSFQFIVFYGLTKIFAVNHGLIPKGANYSTLFRYFNLERGLISGGLLTLLGSVLLYFGFSSNLKIESTLLFIFPAIIAIALGVQIILFSFFFSILGLVEKK